ncbi:MAG: chorismate mutase [Myxococcota bacterium]
MSESLEQLRQAVDDVDRQLLTLLAHRQVLVRQVGLLKQLTGAPVHVPSRAQEVFERRKEWGAAQGLSPSFIEALWHMVHTESCRVQQEVIDRLNQHRPHPSRDDH